MIKIEKVSIHGLEETIRGMRNPMNSWDKSDSGICKGGDDGIGCENCAKEVPCEHTYDHSFQLGKADHELMMKLAAGGPVHAKYRRMITVYLDITAPLKRNSMGASSKTSMVADDSASPIFLQPETDGHAELRSACQHLSLAQRA